MSSISETDHATPLNSPLFFSGAVGAKFRYAAVGFSVGYFKLGKSDYDYNKVGDNSVTPIGMDFTITDFKRKKISPVITGQWYKTDYNEHYTIGQVGHLSYTVIGKNLYTLSGGMAIPVFKTGRILVTLGYGQLRSKTEFVQSYNPYFHPNATGTTYTYKKDHQDLLIIGTSLVF